jgi:hypothetical protein
MCNNSTRNINQLKHQMISYYKLYLVCIYFLYLFIPMCYKYIIRIGQSNTPLYCLTLTSDYMFRSHDHHQIYTYNIGPNRVSYRPKHVVWRKSQTIKWRVKLSYSYYIFGILTGRLMFHLFLGHNGMNSAKVPLIKLKVLINITCFGAHCAAI